LERRNGVNALLICKPCREDGQRRRREGWAGRVADARSRMLDLQNFGLQGGLSPERSGGGNERSAARSRNAEPAWQMPAGSDLQHNFRGRAPLAAVGRHLTTRAPLCALRAGAAQRLPQAAGCATHLVKASKGGRIEWPNRSLSDLEETAEVSSNFVHSSHLIAFLVKCSSQHLLRDSFRQSHLRS
jgi:hypothetical protein